MSTAARLALLVALTLPASAQGQGLEVPLVEGTPDPANGRRIVTDRRKGLCLLCHSGPFAEERFQGNLAPSLAGAGSRQGEAMLRQRIVDSRKINPDSLMPAYFRHDGLTRVGTAWQARTLLSAQEVEDVVAFLMTLKE